MQKASKGEGLYLETAGAKTEEAAGSGRPLTAQERTAEYPRMKSASSRKQQYSQMNAVPWHVLECGLLMRLTGNGTCRLLQLPPLRHTSRQTLFWEDTSADHENPGPLLLPNGHHCPRYSSSLSR